MSNRGRKPKPAVVHLLNGNPSKSSLDKRFEKETDASKIRIEEAPLAPEWLDPIARGEWRRVAELLLEIKVLTEADISALEMYCKSYSRWKNAERELDDHGSTVMVMETKNGGTYMQQMPQVAIAQKYQTICKNWMSEFGLTPSARAKGVKQEKGDDVDAITKKFSDIL